MRAAFAQKADVPKHDLAGGLWIEIRSRAVWNICHQTAVSNARQCVRAERRRFRILGARAGRLRSRRRVNVHDPAEARRIAMRNQRKMQRANHLQQRHEQRNEGAH